MSFATLQNLNTWQIIAICIGITLIVSWMIVVVYWLNSMFKKYTLNTEYDNPFRNETLGLPNGTMRSILTLTILFVVVILVCLSMLVQQLQGSYENMMTAFEVMLAFYFGGKIMEQVSTSDKEKAKIKYQEEVKKAHAEASGKVNAAEHKPGSFNVDGASG